MKKQIVVIHGGTTFDTYEEYLDYLNSCKITLERINYKDWKDFLVSNLPDFEVIYPKMPNSKNAHYLEWKIWFEKLLPLLRDDVTLIGHSLGGIFLAKYLTENNFPIRIASIHLVAAPYDTEFCKESLGDFALSGKVGKLSIYTDSLFLYQSKDDPEVPYGDVENYKKDIPDAILTTFEDRGHFIQKDFPELLENIKKSSE